MTCPTGRCVTCADEGTPMRVLDAQAGEEAGEVAGGAGGAAATGGAGAPAADGTVRCRAEDGTERQVDASLVEPVAPGDLLLVHAGVALTRISDAPFADPIPETAATEGGSSP